MTLVFPERIAPSHTRAVYLVFGNSNISSCFFEKAIVYHLFL